jgi:hypothetical protein
MAYPGARTHRIGRRHLGRGQSVIQPNVTCILTDAVAVLTLTFSAPVVVTGQIPVTSSGAQTLVSQTVVSPTVVTQTWSATLVSSTITLPSHAANVSTYQGGVVAGVQATF